MVEQKILEEAELSDRVIRGSDGLLAFQTRDANSDVRRSDHVYIIGSISYSKGSFFGVSSTHHANYFSFLFGTDTAGEHDISTLTEVNELLNKIIILLDS